MGNRSYYNYLYDAGNRAVLGARKRYGNGGLTGAAKRLKQDINNVKKIADRLNYPGWPGMTTTTTKKKSFVAGGGDKNGTYKGKFKVAKKKRRTRKGRKYRQKKRFYRQGMVIKREGRGVRTDPDAVYVGQGPNTDLIVKGMAACIFRELCRQSGYTIESFQQTYSELSAFSAFIDFFYRSSAFSTTESSFTYTIVGGSTIDQNIDGLLASIQTAVAGNQIYQFTKARMSTSPSDGVSNSRLTSAYIDLENFMFCVKVSQNMLIQNQTKGGVAADPDDVEDNRESIYANPLYAITFSTNSNGFWPTWREATDLSYESFHAGPTTGLINTNATNSLPSEGVEPSTTLFKESRTRRERLEPGSIKNLKLNYTRCMSFPKAMVQFRAWWLASGTADHTDFGKSNMVAFEKMLKSTTAESDISVAFETNHTIIVKYAYTPIKRINPLVVNASGA